MDFDLKKTSSLQVRVRVCGLHLTDQGILLLKHEGIGKKGFLWSPPGGGIESNENARSALIREFKEETHLDIVVEDFYFANEYLDEQVHKLNKHNAFQLCSDAAYINKLRGYYFFKNI